MGRLTLVIPGSATPVFAASSWRGLEARTQDDHVTHQVLELERGHCPCRVGDVLRGELLEGVICMLCQGRKTLV